MPPKPAAPPAFGYQPHTDHGYQPHHVSYRTYVGFALVSAGGSRTWSTPCLRIRSTGKELKKKQKMKYVEVEAEDKEEEEKKDLRTYVEEEEHEEAEPEEGSFGRTVNNTVTSFVVDFARFQGGSAKTYDFEDILNFLPWRADEWTEEEFKIMKEVFEKTARTGPSGKHLELKNIPEWPNAIDSLEISKKLIGC